MIASQPKIGDWHTHNFRCNHADGTLLDYIKSAIEAKLYIIGLSDHFPNIYSADYGNLHHAQFAMKPHEILHYLNEAQRLKNTLRDKIEVRIGFEVGFIEGQEAICSRNLNKFKKNIDYIIGSVHTVYLENRLWSIKGEDLGSLCEKYGSEKVYRLYYKTMRKMIKSENFDFDIVGHFGFIKTGKECLELEQIIREETEKSLKIVKENDKIIEINMQGLRNGYKKTHPCDYVIKMIHDFDIPILLGSDAHTPSDVGYKFEWIIQKLKEIGFTKIASLEKRQKIFNEL